MHTTYSREKDNSARLNRMVIQPELKVEKLNTFYEKQADEVADAIMMKPSVKDDMVQMQLYKEEGETFQMKPFSGGTDYDIQMLLGSGSLQLKTEKSMETFNGIKRDALAGVTGQGIRLPYYNIIQPAFGKHDLSAVQCHFNSAANKKLGSEAYTIGSHICFAKPPILQTAAHEAAHVIQQKNGVSLKDGIGRPGDYYEQHAEKVAEAVVANREAEGLLNQVAGREKTGLQNQSVQFWDGSEHYIMGNSAGNKAINMLKQENDNQMPTQLRTRDTRLFERGVEGEQEITSRSHWWEKNREQTINIRTRRGSISMGAASRYSGDYDAKPRDLMNRNREINNRFINRNSILPNIIVGAISPLLLFTDLPNRMVGAVRTLSILPNAATNSNHFYPLNHYEYHSKHKRALDIARSARSVQNDPISHRKKLDDAIRIEGFGLHFLQDSYASGHFSPRCLDAMTSWWETINEAEKGRSRTKIWHDFFCMLPDGLPTTEGRFHGDYYMDGNDLEAVSDRCAKSIYNVIASALNMPLKLEPVLPKPKFNEIMADPVAGPPWLAMIGGGTRGLSGYKSDLDSARGRDTTRSGLMRAYKTSGGVCVEYPNIISDLDNHTFGREQKPALAAATKENVIRMMRAIQNYIVKDFDANTYLRLNSYMEKERYSSPHFDILEIENNFHMFSELGNLTFAWKKNAAPEDMALAKELYDYARKWERQIKALQKKVFPGRKKRWLAASINNDLMNLLKRLGHTTRAL